MKGRPPSDKSTTDDDSTESDDNPDNSDDDSEATLSESEFSSPTKKRKRSASGNAIRNSRTIRSIAIPSNSAESENLATKLKLIIANDDVDLIVKIECKINEDDDPTQLRKTVCQHWLRDSVTAGQTLPIALYVLDSEYEANEFEDPSEDIPSNLKSKYACFRKHPLVSPNEELVDALRILKQDRIARGERWNALAYTRAASMMKSFPNRIRSKDDITLDSLTDDDKNTPNTPTKCKAVKNIGDKKIKAKIEEFINYGRITEAENIRNSDIYKIYNTLYSIQGIGPKRAYDLSRSGVKSLSDLVESEKISQEDITLAQHLEVGIPRTEVRRIVGVVAENARMLLPHLTYCICGGYRRGKSVSNDIDVVITQHGCNLLELNQFLVKLTAQLQNIGFLTQLMREVSLTSGYNNDNHDYQSTMLGVVESSKKYGTIDSDEVRYRRLDIIVSQPHSFHLEVLGWTGSIMYERDLRSYVKRFNLKLNTSCVYDEHTNNELDLSGIRSERHLLRYLNLPWIEPENRNCD